MFSLMGVFTIFGLRLRPCPDGTKIVFKKFSIHRESTPEMHASMQNQ